MGGSNSSQRRQRNANEENMYPGMANLRQQQAAAAQEQFQLAQNEVQAANAATRQEQQESRSQRRQSPRRGNHGRIIVNGRNQFMMMSPQLVAPPRHVDSSEADAIKSFAASKASSFSIEVDPVVGDSIWTLTFVMDSTVSSIVHVYIGVRVQLVRDGISLVPVDLLGTPTVEPKNVSSGLNQKVSFELVFMNELPSSILNYDAATAPTHVPLVVSIKYQTSEGIPQCHYALLAFPQGGSRMTVIRELLEVKKIVYQLEHIYGGDVVGGSSSPTNQNKNDSPNGDSGTSAAEDDDENYCVICLSEPLDTTVLPCRHFCMCSSCAEIVKNRNPQQCPVCRGKIDQLLRRK